MATKRVCQHSITVFNHIGEDCFGNAMYSAAVLKNVHTHINEGVSSAEVANDDTRVHIFDDVLECDKAFLPYYEWSALEQEKKVQHWTLSPQGQDFFVFGSVKLLGTALPTGLTLFRINRVSRRQIGSPRMWHWRVEAR